VAIVAAHDLGLIDGDRAWRWPRHAHEVSAQRYDGSCTSGIHQHGDVLLNRRRRLHRNRALQTLLVRSAVDNGVRER